MSICEKSGVHTKFIPDYYGVIPTIPYMEDVAGMPVINIRHVPLTEFYNAAAKRLVDIIGGIVGLIVFSPIMLLAAILVKVSSPGPIIFKQERVGLHQKKFWMYKFRSMRQQVDSEEKKGWTVKKDPRVTWIGRILRKTSLDETPQFFNIVRGDMSLVGPRPERPYFVEKFKEEIPHYMIKHQVRPGLTGWAQINGLRGDTSIQKRIEYDLYYIENWTLGFDFKIILLTFVRGFINKNAYCGKQEIVWKMSGRSRREAEAGRKRKRQLQRKHRRARRQSSGADLSLWQCSRSSFCSPFSPMLIF